MNLALNIGPLIMIPLPFISLVRLLGYVGNQLTPLKLNCLRALILEHCMVDQYSLRGFLRRADLVLGSLSRIVFVQERAL